GAGPDDDRPRWRWPGRRRLRRRPRPPPLPDRAMSTARALDSLDRHRLALGVLVAVAGLAAAVISVQSINGLPFSHPYRVDAIVPADAPIVRSGDEVRIAGQPVGEVRGVSLTPAGREVSIELDHGVIGAG